MVFNSTLQQGNTVQRQIAYKTWLSNLNNGKFVQGFKSESGFSPSYVEVNNNQISRVNIIATVVDVFKSEDGNYFSFTLDDGTSTIKLKAFNEETNKLLNIEKGNLVLVVGRVREYQEELYLSLEITKKLNDNNLELVRRAELLKNLGKPETVKANVHIEVLQTNITPQKHRDASHEQLRQKVLDLLMENDERGVEITVISSYLQKDDATTENVVKELLLEGEIYENRPGFYKAI